MNLSAGAGTHVPQHDQHPPDAAARTPARTCACGCGESIDHRSQHTKYISKTHGQRAYRRRVRAAAQAAGLPVNLNLQTARATGPSRPGNGDPQARRNRPQRPRKPDLRISYRKAVAAIEPLAGSRVRAREALDPLLTPRQRKVLDA